MDLNNITAEQQKGLEFLKVRFQSELDDIKSKIVQLNKPFPDDLTTHLQNSFLNKELLFAPSQQIGLKKDQRKEQLERLKGDENERQYLGRIKLSLEKFAEAGMRQDLENKLLGIVQNPKLTSNKRMSAFFVLMHSLGFGFKRTSDFIVWAFGQMWVYENRRIAKERKAKVKKHKDSNKSDHHKQKIESYHRSTENSKDLNDEMGNNHDVGQSNQHLESHQESKLTKDSKNKQFSANEIKQQQPELGGGDFPKLNLNMNKDSSIAGQGDQQSADINKNNLYPSLKNPSDMYGVQQMGITQNIGGINDMSNFSNQNLNQNGFGTNSATQQNTFQGNQSITFIEKPNNQQNNPKKDSQLQQNNTTTTQNSQSIWLLNKIDKQNNDNNGSNNQSQLGQSQFGAGIQDPLMNPQYNMSGFNLQEGQGIPQQSITPAIGGSTIGQGLQQETSPKNKDNADKKDPKNQNEILQSQIQLYNLIQVKLNSKIKALEEQNEEKTLQMNQLFNICENSKTTFQDFLVNLFQLLQQYNVSKEVQTQVQSLARQHQFVNSNKRTLDQVQGINEGEQYQGMVGTKMINTGNDMNQNMTGNLTKIEPKVEHNLQNQFNNNNDKNQNMGLIGDNNISNQNNNLMGVNQNGLSQMNNSNISLMQQQNLTSQLGINNNFNTGLSTGLGGLSTTGHLGMQNNLGTGSLSLNNQFSLIGGESGMQNTDFNPQFMQQNLNMNKDQ